MKSNYKIEIDCLRAIAVIAVIFYHAKITLFDFKPFNGGFIGVDIFIVISGYVITKLFLKKNFSYSYFFERRLRRLFPALLLLMVVTLIFSYFLFLPLHFSQLGQSVISINLYLSNFLYWYQTDYWAPAALTKPLLHSWTLSLEVQFYLFISLIFWIFRVNYAKILSIFFIISIIFLLNKSILFFEYNYRDLSLGNYYLIFTRLWEFLIGSLIAIHSNKEHQNNSFKIIKYFPTIGLVLLLISFIVIHTPKGFPNINSFIPIAGVSMILFSINKNYSNFLLKSKILGHFGKISYSLYLWHFPILIFFLYNFDYELTNLQIIIALTITYFIALGSYTYIEHPFFKKNILSKTYFLSLVSISSLSLIVFSILISSEIIKPKLYFKYDSVIKKYPNYNFLVEKNKKSSINQFTNSKKIKILVCGDSHGEDLVLAIQSNPNLSKKFETEFSLYINCLKVKKTNYQIKNSVEVLNTDQKMSISNYVFSSIALNDSVNTFENIRKLRSIVVDDLKKKFVIVGTTPEFRTDSDLLLNYLIKNISVNYDIKENIKKTNKFFFNNLKPFYENINKNLYIIAKELDAIYLDKFDYICNMKNNSCYALNKDANKMFFDYSHTTEKGDIFFGKKIEDLDWLKLIN